MLYELSVWPRMSGDSNREANCPLKMNVKKSELVMPNQYELIHSFQWHFFRHSQPASNILSCYVHSPPRLWKTTELEVAAVCMWGVHVVCESALNSCASALVYMVYTFSKKWIWGSLKRFGQHMVRIKHNLCTFYSPFWSNWVFSFLGWWCAFKSIIGKPFKLIHDSLVERLTKAKILGVHQWISTCSRNWSPISRKATNRPTSIHTSIDQESWINPTSKNLECWRKPEYLDKTPLTWFFKYESAISC